MPQERTKTEKELDPKRDISFEEAFRTLVNPPKKEDEEKNNDPEKETEETEE